MTGDAEGARLDAAQVTALIEGVLTHAGSVPAQAADVARALTGASLRGVDSHGLRLLPHYARALAGGRINSDPRAVIRQTAPATATCDADNGFGHWAGYLAVTRACALARQTGVAAISVTNSSHFGAAGAYVLQAAEAGLVAFAFSNSDSFVLPHDGTQPFHGTNPIAFAAPVAGARPYLLDMATSILPWNRIRDYETKGLTVPPDVAVDAQGQVATDPRAVAALLPFGGSAYGYKGAGLAGMIEVMSAVMTGMAHCSRLLHMAGSDMSTPRRLGQFYIVLNPDVFVPRADFTRGMADYLADLRAAPARDGRRVMAPGDREWAVEAERSRRGIPVNPGLLAELRGLAEAAGLEPL